MSLKGKWRRNSADRDPERTIHPRKHYPSSRGYAIMQSAAQQEDGMGYFGLQVAFFVTVPY